MPWVVEGRAASKHGTTARGAVQVVIEEGEVGRSSDLKKASSSSISCRSVGGTSEGCIKSTAQQEQEQQPVQETHCSRGAVRVGVGEGEGASESGSACGLSGWSLAESPRLNPAKPAASAPRSSDPVHGFGRSPASSARVECSSPRTRACGYSSRQSFLEEECSGGGSGRLRRRRRVVGRFLKKSLQRARAGAGAGAADSASDRYHLQQDPAVPKGPSPVKRLLRLTFERYASSSLDVPCDSQSYSEYADMSAAPPQNSYPSAYPPHQNGGHPPPGAPGSGPPPPGAGDSYFTETRKGEVNELRQLLRNFSVEKDQHRKREIIKKVIAYMTLGIDVSRLFTEMMLAIETRDLVVKKMVYLFLCNYAVTNPELAQMCTNTLQKDCSNDDPMVRGLALRALCSLNLPEMVEYIGEPLRKSLKDHHAYVRKTGVMGILKLYHLDRAAFERCNFVDILYDMLRDADAQVVSNCILVLGEIMSGPDAHDADGGLDEHGLPKPKKCGTGMAINRAIILHLLNRIHEFTEFGVIAVLNLIPRYRPANEEEMYQIMNLLDPVFRTSNSGAVLATIRAFLSLAEQCPAAEDRLAMQRQLVDRVKAPLLTLAAGGGSELFYCLLKHVDVLTTLAPGAFDDEYRMFYVRYNEPTCNKYLKVTILSKLVSPFNAADVIAELSEYVTDVDSHLSRLAVRSIARIACSPRGGAQEGTAETIARRLVEFLDLDVEHVSAEAAIALVDVIRKHPELGPIVAPPLPRALRFISERNEPAGRASVVWLLGELGDDIREAPYALEKLINNYDSTKDAGVKTSLLTATMKLFFKRPPEVRHMLGRLLKSATDDVSSQDLHDRALLYHRLLRNSPKVAELVVCGTPQSLPLDRPFAEEQRTELHEALMKEFNTLSIVYGQPSETFIEEEYRVGFELMPEEGVVPGENGGPPAPEVKDVSDQLQQTSITTNGGAAPAPVAAAPAPVSAPMPAVADGTMDLLGFDDPTPSAAAVPSPASSLMLKSAVTMTGDTYQNMWGAQANPVSTMDLAFSHPVGSTEGVEKLLEQNKIFTMASGELPTELKFFLYAQEDGGEQVTFLMQAVISKSPPRMNLSTKTSGGGAGDGEKVKLLEGVMKTALQGYI